MLCLDEDERKRIIHSTLKDFNAWYLAYNKEFWNIKVTHKLLFC